MRIKTGLCNLFALFLWAEAGICEPASRRATSTRSRLLLRRPTTFVENNLQLLAARFGIGAARAVAYQAGLWSNPNIAVEQNA